MGFLNRALGWRPIRTSAVAPTHARPTDQTAATPVAPVVVEGASPELISPHRLRLTNDDGEIVTRPASNYYVHEDGSRRPIVDDLAKLVLSRPAEAQRMFADRITRAHADAEMSFRVKDPETGAYDKVFEVPCHPNPIPLEQRHFDALVESTGPVMRSLRELLQIFYSKPNATAEDLGLADLPAEERDRLMETIRGSVYFEPKLVDANMADYPFLSVAGFDAAVGDLDDPDPIFFEFNLGTPSGLSNNIQLLEVLREQDPEMYEVLRQRLPKDETFTILADAIRSNAEAWTKRPDGISVVIGPGVANGAHPDVASIAHYSGMPLVNPSDLYEDNNGDIRLNTPNLEPHPYVTGIYGRMEESYFLQDSDAGYPIRDPHLVDSEALSKRLGVKLEPGILYDFVYDEQDPEKIVDVKKDAEGRPQLAKVFESIGQDPARPDAKRGSFADAIKNRKLYYSGLGGRVVDDKRVFQAISRYVAPRHLRSDGEPIARPPRTLDVSEYEQFYSSEDLTRFVVKAPDRSGGDGVMLMCNLTEEKRRQVVEEVRANPSQFIVQEMVPSAVTLSPERGEDGKLGLGSLMTDWRIFSAMDANGDVRAGANSLLLRVAKAASASTNTSQGGGYGLGTVLAPPGEGAVRKPGESLLPTPPKHAFLTQSKVDELDEWLKLFALVLQWSDPEAGNELQPIGNATFLADRQRGVMELLGRDFADVMPLLRRYDKGEETQETVHLTLLELRNRLLAHDDFPVDGVQAIIRDHLGTYLPPQTAKVEGPAPQPRTESLAKLKLTELESPRAIFEAKSGDVTSVVFETATYAAPPPAIVAANERLAKFGGEVRFVREKIDGAWSDFAAAPHFRVEDGVPFVGLDVTQPNATSALAHQMAYFEVFEESVQSLVRDGVEPDLAAKMAGVMTKDVSLWARAERRGIKAAIATDLADTSELNRSDYFRPTTPRDPGYASRVGHVDVEAIRSVLFAGKVDGDLDVKLAKEHLNRLVHTTKKANAAHLDVLRARVATGRRTTSSSARLRRMRDEASIHALETTPLFELCFDGAARARFEENGTLDQLRQLFDEVVAERSRPARTRGAMFESPASVRNGRDSIDEARDNDPTSVASRVLLAGMSVATGVQGYQFIAAPLVEQTMFQNVSREQRGEAKQHDGGAIQVDRHLAQRENDGGHDHGP